MRIQRLFIFIVAVMAFQSSNAKPPKGVPVKLPQKVVTAVDFSAQKTPARSVAQEEKVEKEEAVSVLNTDKNLKKKLFKGFDVVMTKIRKGTLEKKMSVIAEYEKSMKETREKYVRQSEEDEIEMDQLVYSLEMIPRGDKFKASECSDYESKIKYSLDPTSENSKLWTLKVTLSVLKEFCNTK